MEANRTRVSYVAESTFGVTPAISGTTEMRTIRTTGEGLSYDIDVKRSNELRSDRMNSDLIQSSARNNGGLNFEMSYPLYRTFFDEFLAAAICADWTNTPVKHNITSGNEISAVAAGTGVLTVNSGGTSFIAGHLVQASGFTNAANNGIFKVSASTSTSVTLVNASSAAETPPVGARLKVVGWEAASADLTITTAGGNKLNGTATNFVTLGIQVGQHIKIGGDVVGQQFATAADNTWGIVTAVSATSLTLSNVNSGFAADTGTGKTIRFWFGDMVKNGSTKKSFTIERGFLSQATPSYLTHLGNMVTGLNMNLKQGEIITGDFSLIGTSHATSTTSLGTPAAASNENIFSATNNVGRIAEYDTPIATPSFCRGLSLSLNNNLNPVEQISSMYPADMTFGSFEVKGSLEVYFGDKAIYDRYLGGTNTNLNTRMYSGTRAFCVHIPSMELTSAKPNAGGLNQQIVMPVNFEAKYDSSTAAHLILNRLDYFV